MTSKYILPVALSILREGKVSDLSYAAIAIFTPNPTFGQILDREIHALEFIMKGNVAKSSIS